MSNPFRVFKVSILPSTFIPDALYMVPSTTVGYFDLYVSTHDGSSVQRVPSSDDIDSKITAALAAYAASQGGVTTSESKKTLIAQDLAYSRKLKSLFASIQPLATLPDTVVIKKLKTTGIEFAVFTALTTDGREWVRWLYSNRFNPGSIGSPRLIFASQAMLFQSVSTDPYSANQGTPVEGQMPSVTLYTANGTSRTGTWTTAAVVNSVADTRYATVAGAKVVYTFTNTSRIVLQASTNATNGGYGKVVVKSAGVEILSGYVVDLINSYRRVNYKDQQVGNNLQYITVADGLPQGTYTLELSVATDNPASGRVFDSGAFGYTAISTTAIGQQGIFTDITLSSYLYRCAFYSGARVTYTFTGTKVSYRYGIGTDAGMFTARVYDSTGVEISPANYLVPGNVTDAYKSTGYGLMVLPIVEDLVYGTYYLVVQSNPEKNSLSTGRRLYDYGITAYNQNLAGVPGTDTFDILGIPSVYQDLTDIPTDRLFIGIDSVELSLKVRRTIDAQGSENYVGGLNGFESNVTAVDIKLDGNFYDFTNAALDTVWTAKNMTIGFSSSLKFPLGGTSVWATVTQLMSWGSSGYSVKITREATAAAVIYDESSLMLPVPNTTWGGSYANRGKGGGFPRWAVDIGETIDAGNSNDAITEWDRYGDGVIAYNNSYGVAAFSNSVSDTRNVYAGTDSNSAWVKPSKLHDTYYSCAKFTTACFSYDAVAGRTIAAGDKVSHTTHYRVIKYNGFESLLST